MGRGGGSVGGTSFLCGGTPWGTIDFDGGGGSKKIVGWGQVPPSMGNPVKQALLSKFQECFRTTVG